MKICSRCKILKEDDQFRLRYDKRGKGSKKLTYLNNTCKKCDSEISNRSYFKNKYDPEFHKNWIAKSNEYYHKNKAAIAKKMKEKRQTPEYKIKMKTYREKRKSIIQQQEVITKRRYHEKHRDGVTDSYVIRQLVTQGFGKYEEIEKNKDLIEIKRIKILNKRLRNEIAKRKKK